jgi:peptidoglycan/LPS O-acetylase OafA/YrhL
MDTTTTNFETVEFWGMRMTKWALAVLVAGSIAALLVLVIGFFATTPHPMYFISAALLLLGTILVTYNVNCLQIGRCELFSKFIVVLAIIEFTIFILLHIGVGFFREELKELQQFDYVSKNVDSMTNSVKKTLKSPYYK